VGSRHIYSTFSHVSAFNVVRYAQSAQSQRKGSPFQQVRHRRTTYGQYLQRVTRGDVVGIRQHGSTTRRIVGKRSGGCGGSGGCGEVGSRRFQPNAGERG